MTPPAAKECRPCHDIILPRGCLCFTLVETQIVLRPLCFAVQRRTPTMPAARCPVGARATRCVPLLACPLVAGSTGGQVTRGESQANRLRATILQSPL